MLAWQLGPPATTHCSAPGAIGARRAPAQPTVGHWADESQPSESGWVWRRTGGAESWYMSWYLAQADSSN